MTSDKSSSRNQPEQRLYIPAAYVDEVCPPGRVNPDAWIGTPAGDVWLLATEEDIDFGLTLKPGETIEFDGVERLGAVEVEIRDDGTHAARGLVPDGVTHFTFGMDVLADTLDEFVREWLSLGMDVDDDRLVLVDMARWSPEHEPFRFEVAEGGPRFVPVGTGASE